MMAYAEAMTEPQGPAPSFASIVGPLRDQSYFGKGKPAFWLVSNMALRHGLSTVANCGIEADWLRWFQAEASTDASA